jgi:hypothetical protein
MRKAVIAGIIIAFGVCLIHFCLHAHHLDAGSSTCPCFWTSLGPEWSEFARDLGFEPLSVEPGRSALIAPLGSDIAHPPNTSLV